MFNLSELRQWLSQEGMTANDALLTAIELRAVDLVEGWTGRYFGATDTTATEYFDGDGESRVLWLADEPNAEPAIYTRDSLLSSWVVVSGTYIEHEGRKVTNLLEAWPAGERNIKAVYSRGYSSGATVPEDIRQLVLDTCKALFLQSRLGDNETDLVSRIPFAAETIGRYRRPLL